MSPTLVFYNSPFPMATGIYYHRKLFCPSNPADSALPTCNLHKTTNNFKKTKKTSWLPSAVVENHTNRATSERIVAARTTMKINAGAQEEGRSAKRPLLPCPQPHEARPLQRPVPWWGLQIAASPTSLLLSPPPFCCRCPGR